MEGGESAAASMKDDLNAFKGILTAILLSLPLWMLIVFVLILFGVIS